jgi:S1-C subfamily serine protease
MRTIGVAIVALTLTLPLHAADWGVQYSNVLRSIVPLAVEISEDEGTVRGVCTAFSIDEKKSMYLTAAHCYGDVVMKLGGMVDATVVYRDDAVDIMVLQATNPYRRPALHPRSTRVYNGMEVAAIGYGMGFNQPMVRTGLLSIASLIDNYNFGNRPMNIYDFAFVGGMSGGPVVDVDGRVVGIVTGSYRDGTMGAGKPLEDLRRAAPRWK